MTMQFIQSVNGTGASAQVSFSNIPQTFSHLEVRGYVRTAQAANFDTIYIYNYNNNTNSTGSAYHFMAGDGSSVSATGGTASFSTPVGYCPANNLSANIHGTFILSILDYTNTSKNKTLRCLFGYDANGSGYTGIASGLPLTLPGTAAVTSLSIAFNGNITSTSRFDLYGIVSNPIATGV